MMPPMPHGFFTIEQWKQPRKGKGRWVVIQHLDRFKKLSDAIDLLAARKKPGFYRVIQTQRMIWAETGPKGFKMHKWHALEVKTLERTAKAFVRDRRKWPR